METKKLSIEEKIWVDAYLMAIKSRNRNKNNITNESNFEFRRIADNALDEFKLKFNNRQ